MDLELIGKRALVTGGSRGIGKAIARVLAQEGVDVALLARGADALAATATEIGAQSGRKVIGVAADTTSDAQVRDAVAEAVRLLGGPIDILVNAAAEPTGFASPPTLEQITGEVHPGTTRTERTAPMVAAHAAAQGIPAAEVEAQMAARNSIRHLVDASEVANVVVFLCSPKSRAVNGDVITAGGGAPRAIHY